MVSTEIEYSFKLKKHGFYHYNLMFIYIFYRKNRNYITTRIHPVFEKIAADMLLIQPEKSVSPPPPLNL